MKPLKIFSRSWPNLNGQNPNLFFTDFTTTTTGTPQCYSMEDLPGKYVEVDREAYIRHAWNVSGNRSDHPYYSAIGGSAKVTTLRITGHSL
jgi:hypothetical protein